MANEEWRGKTIAENGQYIGTCEMVRRRTRLSLMDKNMCVFVPASSVLL